MIENKPLISFVEDTHSYICNNIKLKSVTWAIEQVASPFDENEVSLRTAYKKHLGEDRYKEITTKLFGRNPFYNTEDAFPCLDYFSDKDELLKVQKEILFDWEETRRLGTVYHLKQEKESYKRGYELNQWTNTRFKCIEFPKTYDNESLCDNLYDLEDGYYPELLVWDNTVPMDITLCGQADKVFIETVGGVRYIDIGDFKFNKKVPIRYKNKKLKAPLDKISDNKVDKYFIQISYYAYMLETFGFTPRNLSFTHFLDYDLESKTVFKTDYLKEEILLLKNFIYGS